MRRENKYYIVINSLTILAVIIVNALANILPINGVQTGQVSRDFETLFTPSGFTFSIWSIIYLGLIAFSAFSFTEFNTKKSSFSLRLKNSIWLSNALNILWILAWHYYWIGTSLIVMIGLLVSLTYINLTLYDYRTKVKNSATYFWFVRVPYSLYLGWIVVATAANFSVFLTYVDWSGFGILPEFWLVLVILTGTLVATFLIYNYRLYASGIAVAWGVYGISSNLILKNEDLIVIYLCYGVIAVITLSIFLKVRRPELKFKI